MATRLLVHLARRWRCMGWGLNVAGRKLIEAAALAHGKNRSSVYSTSLRNDVRHVTRVQTQQPGAFHG